MTSRSKDPEANEPGPVAGMRRSTSALEHATVGLVLILATTAVVVIGCFWAAQRASDRREQTLIALADDVIRVSQAQVAAERMVVVGRAYLLTKEPKLLARAQAASAKLERTLQELQQEPALSKDHVLLDPALISAARYRKQFDELASDPAASATPTAVAESLRTRLLPARDRLESDLQQLIIKRQQGEAEVRESTGDRASRAIRMMLVLGVLGLVASALVALAVIGSLKRLNQAPRLQVRTMNLSAALRPVAHHGDPGASDDRASLPR